MNPEHRAYLARATILTLLMVILPSVCGGALPTLDTAQKHALVEAYRAGNHYGIGLLFAAVVMQESTACMHAGTSSAHAYGCAQIRESAVIAVTGAPLPAWELLDPTMQDENMAIGARYLDLCLQRFGYPAGIGCYYVGPDAGAKLGRKRLSRLPYTKAVLANMKMLEQLPQSEE